MCTFVKYLEIKCASTKMLNLNRIYILCAPPPSKKCMNKTLLKQIPYSWNFYDYRFEKPIEEKVRESKMTSNDEASLIPEEDKMWPKIVIYLKCKNISGKRFYFPSGNYVGFFPSLHWLAINGNLFSPEEKATEARWHLQKGLNGLVGGKNSRKRSLKIFTIF